MMTSIAFIFGLLPLVIATGAAQITRRDIGTPVFSGMIAASSIGIFLIPMLYLVFQWLRETVKARLFVKALPGDKRRPNNDRDRCHEGPHPSHHPVRCTRG